MLTCAWLHRTIHQALLQPCYSECSNTYTLVCARVRMSSIQLDCSQLLTACRSGLDVVVPLLFKRLCSSGTVRKEEMGNRVGIQWKIIQRRGCRGRQYALLKVSHSLRHKNERNPKVAQTSFHHLLVLDHAIIDGLYQCSYCGVC